MKPICLRLRSMDCCLPCSPLLSSCLGKRMATLLRAVQIAPGWGFPCEPLPSALSLLPSQASGFYFHLAFPPFLTSPPVPSHPISAALSRAYVGGAGLPFLSQWGGSTQWPWSLATLCFWLSKRASSAFATAAGCPALPSPSAAVVSVACSAETASSQVLWPKMPFSVGCAVPFCHVFGY